RWAAIACHLPGRTDNDVKNFWNSHLMKRVGIEQSSSSPPTSNSVHHQWEPPVSKPSGGGDYFMRLWNSEVGESFRNINDFESDGVCHSPCSQTSSLTKVESSWYKPEREMDDGDDEPWSKNDPATCSDASKSHCEMDDSSAMLKLLLEFPAGENDMGFLQDDL
ncbi:hypothetical protein M569_04867, partial [Genlisea aurea]